jgi:hypothetical protein
LQRNVTDILVVFVVIRTLREPVEGEAILLFGFVFTPLALEERKFEVER